MLKSGPVEAGVECVIFSDTLVISASDLKPRSYPWFLRKCKDLITKSIYVELPIRGAISVGPIFFSTDPTIVIGSAFLEAYEYCEAQNWIGLLMTPSATQSLRKIGLEPLHHDFVSDELPLRKKSTDEVLAYRFQNGRANFKSALLPHLNQMQRCAPEKAKPKYQNTVSFIERHYSLIEEGSGPTNVE